MKFMGSRRKIGEDGSLWFGVLLLCLLLSSFANAVERNEPVTVPGMATTSERVLAAKKKLLEQLDEIDKELNLVSAQWEKLNADLKRAERQRSRLRSRLSETREELQTVRARARARLIALYKFSTMDYLLPLSRVHDFYSAMHAVYAISRLIEKDHATFTRLRKKQEQVRVLRASLGEYEWQYHEVRRQLQRQVDRLVRSKEAKIRLLIRMNRSLESVDRYAANTDLQTGARILSSQRSRTPSEDLFANQKGRLPLPVPGKVMVTYGKKHSPYRSVLYNNGALIRTRRDEPVRAVFAGRVVFADRFRGYGNIMIIDHGFHYYTLIAHLSSMYRKAGDQVIQGEMVATAGPSSVPGEGELYLEIRYHEKPLDPSQWLVSAKQSMDK